MGASHCLGLAAAQGSCTLGWVTPPDNSIQIYKDLVPVDFNTEDTPTSKKKKKNVAVISLGIVSTVAAVGGLVRGLYDPKYLSSH